MMMPTEHLALIVNDVQRERIADAAAYRLTRAGQVGRRRAPGRRPWNR